jgi:hypothetical protein
VSLARIRPAATTCVRPFASSTEGSGEPAPVPTRRRRRMRRSRVLPVTGRGPRPRGKHAGGQVRHGIPQGCVDHLLPRQALGVAHNVRQVRIELNRSRCGAVTPESPARASRTPPSAPPTRAARERPAIALFCPVLIMHIGLPFSARVGSGHGCLLAYDGATEKTRHEIRFENCASHFCVCTGNRSQARCQSCMGWSRTDHSVPERPTPKHDTQSLTGRSRLRGGSLSDLKQPVEFSDVE